MKHGAVELAPDSRWAIWHDLAGLAVRLPRPDDELMSGLRKEAKWWRAKLRM